MNSQQQTKRQRTMKAQRFGELKRMMQGGARRPFSLKHMLVLDDDGRQQDEQLFEWLLILICVDPSDTVRIQNEPMNELGTCLIYDLKHVDVMLNDDETASYVCKPLNGHSGAVSDAIMSPNDWM